jgi:uncharacterized protein (TIGR03000 family)
MEKTMYAKLIALVALLTGLLLADSAFAGGPLPGVPSGWPPWDVPGWKGYRPPAQPVQPPPPVISAPPVQYYIVDKVVPQKLAEDYANKAVVMAHLPAIARVWVDDDLTTSIGKERYYVSPPLTPGKEYNYTFRVAWVEEGKWVAQTSVITVTAGEMHCFYLSANVEDKEAAIKANLAKLSPEGRKLAESQKFCAIEDNRLGAVGVPIKVMVKDQPVFLCCDGCKEKTLADPDKTLAKVKELKAKAAEVPPK